MTLPCALNTQHGPPGRRAAVLPPSPGWKESMSDDTQCEETVYKSGHATPHRKRHLSVAHVVGNATPARGRLFRAPSMGCGGCLPEKPHAEADVFCGHPSMGSGGGFGGRKQGRSRACSLILKNKEKLLSPGLCPGLRRWKSVTACRRNARFCLSAVMYGLNILNTWSQTESGDLL